MSLLTGAERIKYLADLKAEKVVDENATRYIAGVMQRKQKRKDVNAKSEAG